MLEGWNTPIRSPFLFLFLGYIFFSMAVIWTDIGRVWVRFHGWVYRAKEPKWFWWEVATWYLGGIVFIGISLYM